MPDRRMDYPPAYGLDHPTWAEPSCFHYATAAEASASIVAVYGPDSGHVVVRRARVTSPSPTPNADESGARA